MSGRGDRLVVSLAGAQDASVGRRFAPDVEERVDLDGVVMNRVCQRVWKRHQNDTPVAHDVLGEHLWMRLDLVESGHDELRESVCKVRSMSSEKAVACGTSTPSTSGWTCRGRWLTPRPPGRPRLPRSPDLWSGRGRGWRATRRHGGRRSPAAQKWHLGAGRMSHDQAQCGGRSCWQPSTSGSGFT